VRIDQLLASSTRPLFSFEFFPPRTPAGESNLRDALTALADFSPDFASVTYGAGGSTRQRTLEVTRWLKAELEIEAMAHLTLVGASVDELRATLDALAETGIENVLALRGDAAKGEAWRPHPAGLRHANELVRLISREYELTVGGACFPEMHPESTSRDSDIAYLKLKVRAGASFLITQLFFENRLYFDFVAACRAAGIETPILPGIMPITSIHQLDTFTSMCGASVPPTLRDRLDDCRSDAEVVSVGIEHALEQCQGLLAGGAPGIHFYTLNRSPATRTVLAELRAQIPSR
jgi:methylenetetrahydrofolate reductase (NADPH)